MQENRPFLPYGFQFRPTDEELLVRYLYKKVSGTLNKILPFVECFIMDCDLYDKQPSDIWKSHGGPSLNADEDLYFFTQLRKKTSKGSRINRKVGSFGAWQGENGAEDIVTGESKLNIGSKKRFRYENKGSEDHGAWIVHEYSLRLPKNQTTDYVLCRFRKNQPSEKPNKRKRLDAQNNQSEEDLEKFWTLQRNSVECQSEAAGSLVPVAHEEACCSDDKHMMCEQVISAHQYDFNYGTLEREETGGIDYSGNNYAVSQQYGVQMAVPVQTVQTWSVLQQEEEACCSSDKEMMCEQVVSAHQCDFNCSTLEGNETCGIDYSDSNYTVSQQYDMQMAVPDQTVQTRSMLQQQECSYGDDPLDGLSDEDFCLIRKILPEAQYEESRVIMEEQEARWNTGMIMSYQSVSGNNGLQTGGMDNTTSVAELHEAALTGPDGIIQCPHRSQLIGVNNLECQREATMEMMSEFKQILSDNTSVMEEGNLERQETGGIVYDVPMEVEDDILQLQYMEQYEEWSDSDLTDLLVELTDENSKFS